jgi:adenosine deaminase
MIWCGSTIRKEWCSTIELELDPAWLPAIETVQTHLLRRLVDRHIVIEVNPSSNLTLGAMDDMVDHPIFRWLDPRTDFHTHASPLVVVGTDDPSAFATELLHEYAYLGRTAEQLGATTRQVQAWLEHLRESGILCSFFPRTTFEPATRDQWLVGRS